VQSVSTTTKLRQKFYAQVQRRSFHTAWVINGPRPTPDEAGWSALRANPEEVSIRETDYAGRISRSVTARCARCSTRPLTSC